MTDYKQGQQDMIDSIKKDVGLILDHSEGVDIMLDVMLLLQKLEAKDGKEKTHRHT